MIRANKSIFQAILNKIRRYKIKRLRNQILKQVINDNTGDYTLQAQVAASMKPIGW